MRHLDEQPNGTTFDRTFGQQAIKKTKGGDWTNDIAWSNGGPQTGPRELSFYRPGERFTLRLDGFTSIHAGEAPGKMTTKPLTFEGDRLLRNDFVTRETIRLRMHLKNADVYSLRLAAKSPASLETNSLQ